MLRKVCLEKRETGIVQKGQTHTPPLIYRLRHCRSHEPLCSRVLPCKLLANSAAMLFSGHSVTRLEICFGVVYITLTFCKSFLDLHV